MARQNLRWLSRATALLLNSLQDEGFPRLLRRLLFTQLPFSNMIVTIYPQSSKPFCLHAWLPNTRLHNHYQKHYLTNTYQLDPFFQICNQPFKTGAYFLKDVAPDRFFQSEYFLSYYRGSTMVDELCLISELNDGSTIHMSIGRDDKLGRFNKIERQFLGDIEVILCSLLSQFGNHRLSQTTESKQEQPEALEVRLHKYSESLPNLTPLTPREAQVAAMVLKGHSSLSAGLVLGIALETVKIHRKKVYKKLQVGTQAELFARLSHLLVGQQ
jgi:DNA-binding CsgD family transcriptional regulator